MPKPKRTRTSLKQRVDQQLFAGLLAVQNDLLALLRTVRQEQARVVVHKNKTRWNQYEQLSRSLSIVANAVSDARVTVNQVLEVDHD